MTYPINSFHKVFQSDNRRLSILEPNSIDLVVTSPPYVTTEFKRGQEFDYEGFMKEFGVVCDLLFRALKPGGRFALNVADVITKYRYPDEDTIARVPFGSDTLQSAMNSGFRFLERYIWDKGFTRNFGGPLLGSYPYPPTIFNNNYFEYIYILRKPGKRKTTNVIRKNSRVSLDEWRKWTQQWWRVESISEKIDFHRAVFPFEIPHRLIRMYSYDGDTVLDPYGGTCATMMASYLSKRSSISFEIDDCATLIEKRLEYERKNHPSLSELKYELITQEYENTSTLA